MKGMILGAYRLDRDGFKPLSLEQGKLTSCEVHSDPARDRLFTAWACLGLVDRYLACRVGFVF